MTTATEDAEAEARRKRRWVPTFHLPSAAFRPLSASDARQIDALVEWWLDDDTWFGMLNLHAGLLGIVIGFVWAIVGIVTGGFSVLNLVLLPLVGVLGGMVAGMLAPTALLVLAAWKLGSVVISLF